MNYKKKTQLITTVLKYKLLIPIYKKLLTRATKKITMFIFILHKTQREFPASSLKEGQSLPKWDHKKNS